MIQFQNESVVVRLELNTTAIFLTWKGFVPRREYREGLEASLEIAKKHKIKNWISDISLLEGISVKDQEWVGREWLPKAVSAGCYQNQAVIVAKDIFEQVSALNILTSFQNQPIVLQHFTNLRDARKWLKDGITEQAA